MVTCKQSDSVSEPHDELRQHRPQSHGGRSSGKRVIVEVVRDAAMFAELANDRMSLAFLQYAAGVLGVPHIPVSLVFHKLLFGAFSQIDVGHRFCALVADLVNPPVRAIPDFFLLVVARLLVVPVDQVDVAVGAVRMLMKRAQASLARRKSLPCEATKPEPSASGCPCSAVGRGCCP